MHGEPRPRPTAGGLRWGQPLHSQRRLPRSVPRPWASAARRRAAPRDMTSLGRQARALGVHQRRDGARARGAECAQGARAAGPVPLRPHPVPPLRCLLCGGARAVRRVVRAGDAGASAHALAPASQRDPSTGTPGGQGSAASLPHARFSRTGCAEVHRARAHRRRGGGPHRVSHGAHGTARGPERPPHRLRAAACALPNRLSECGHQRALERPAPQRGRGQCKRHRARMPQPRRGSEPAVDRAAAPSACVDSDLPSSRSPAGL